MDSLREQRFIIPPFFLLSIVSINCILSKDVCSLLNNCDINNLELLLTIIALFITTYTFGYIIGAISIFVISLFWKNFYFKKWKQYNINDFDTFHKEAYLILRGVDKNGNEFINENLRDWIVRRWSIVTININSITGILLGWCLSIKFLSLYFKHWWWVLINIIIILILAFNTKKARKDILDIEEKILKDNLNNRNVN